MTPKLYGQTVLPSISGLILFVCKSVVGIKRQRNRENCAIVTKNLGCHVRILIQLYFGKGYLKKLKSIHVCDNPEKEVSWGIWIVLKNRSTYRNINLYPESKFS